MRSIGEFCKTDERTLNDCPTHENTMKNWSHKGEQPKTITLKRTQKTKNKSDRAMNMLFGRPS